MELSNLPSNCVESCCNHSLWHIWWYSHWLGSHLMNYHWWVSAPKHCPRQWMLSYILLWILWWISFWSIASFCSILVEKYNIPSCRGGFCFFACVSCRFTEIGCSIWLAWFSFPFGSSCGTSWHGDSVNVRLMGNAKNFKVNSGVSKSTLCPENKEKKNPWSLFFLLHPGVSAYPLSALIFIASISHILCASQVNIYAWRRREMVKEKRHRRILEFMRYDFLMGETYLKMH